MSPYEPLQVGPELDAGREEGQSNGEQLPASLQTLPGRREEGRGGEGRGGEGRRGEGRGDREEEGRGEGKQLHNSHSCKHHHTYMYTPHKGRATTPEDSDEEKIVATCACTYIFNELPQADSRL